ncbi:tetratricopeptide repeat protein [Azospirillum sp.]|uniref:tetratricopeptide repeat protein n=1 Tax=Azospirillum sp. TaxID=34012 RepID=UPI0026333BE0|nr:tetratricopeptide repeat protein [Azospirillum sp.]
MQHPMRGTLSSRLPLAEQLALVADPASWRSRPVSAESAPVLALMLARRGRTDLAREILSGQAGAEPSASAAMVTAYARLVAGFPPSSDGRHFLPGKLCPVGEAVAFFAYCIAGQATGAPAPSPSHAATVWMIRLLDGPEPDFAEGNGVLGAIPARPAPPLDEIFWAAWADVMMWAKRPRLALGCLRQLVETTAPTVDACMTYAAACLKHGRTGDIRAIRDRLPEAVRQTPWSRLLEVATLLPTTRLRDATAMAGRLAAEFPDDWMVQAALGYAATLAGGDDALHDRCAAYLAGAPRRVADTPVPGSGAALLIQAEGALSRVTAQCPGPAAWNDLGHHHAVAGNLERAEEAFRMALSLDPQQRHAVINLPLVLLRRGRGDEARAHVADAMFPVDPPPAILALRQGTACRSRSGPDSLEWKRTTVFSYYWRSVLADRLRSDAVGPLPGGRP